MASKSIQTVPAGANIAAAIDTLGNLKREAKKAEECAKRYEEECAIRTAIPTGSWQEAEYYKALLTESVREKVDWKGLVNALERRLLSDAAKIDDAREDTVNRWLRAQREKFSSVTAVVALRVEPREL